MTLWETDSDPITVGQDDLPICEFGRSGLTWFPTSKVSQISRLQVTQI